MAAANEEANANVAQDRNNQIINDQESWKELRQVIGEQQVRIQTLQNTAFQLANYYFVFQGVILAATSNTSTITCSDGWFVSLLSLFAAVLNFFALASIGIKYVRVMNMHDNTWAEYNAMEGRLHDDRNNIQDHHHNLSEDWVDQYSRILRYVVLALCMVIFLVFTVLMVLVPRIMICKHDKASRRHQQDLDCFKHCNGSKCMMFWYKV